ncbi:Leucine Rich Repeat (LRR)-containing protein [Candidatus Magnetoovum chiemensis]|nr:Leucine Rich Repeat (LRR)-containing protein [Candidatus Magnetoovum chiemensis]
MEYWLDTIRNRAPESTVIIVASECEKSTPSGIPFDSLKQDYSDILNTDPFYFFVGCEPDAGCEIGRGIPELSDHLKRLAVDKNILPLMGELWPKTYTASEDRLRVRSNNDNYINRGELQDIYKRYEIPEDTFDSVARTMGDMGIITHFPDCPDLYDFIVLKPQWLTKAISKVMEHSELAVNQGECQHNWLNQIWNDGYSGLFTTLHSAMKEFELCYDLENNKDISLAPLRFGDTKPEEIPWSNIEGAKERRVQYRFDRTPPYGIMSRFIVKTHHLIVKTTAKPKGVYWQNGVFLRTGDGLMRSEALCEFDREKRILQFTVKAAFPQNMIEQLHGFIQAVFSFFEGLTPERHYGCVKNDGSQCEGFHKEQMVTFKLTRPTKIIDCDQGLHEIDAIELISGFTSFPAMKIEKEELRVMFREELDKEPKWAEKFGIDLRSVMIRFDALTTITSELNRKAENIPADISQQLQLVLRDHLNLLNEMLDDRDFNPTPSIISIVPVNRSFWKKDLLANAYILTPYCEADEGIHTVGLSPSSETPKFSLTFKIPNDWWLKTAPVLGTALKVLSIGLSAAAIPLHLVLPTSPWQTIQDEVDAMDNVFKHLTNENDGINIKSVDVGLADLRDDAKFRMVRLQIAELFKEIAPANYGAQQYGDLRRYSMRDGKHRWLCEKHYKKYKN